MFSLLHTGSSIRQLLVLATCSDVNKDLGLKAKDLDPKAKDLSHKAKD